MINFAAIAGSLININIVSFNAVTTTGSSGGSGPTLVKTASAITKTGTSMTGSLQSLPVNCFIITAYTDERDSSAAAPDISDGGDGLWGQAAAAAAGSSGNVYIFTSSFAAGGTLSVTVLPSGNHASMVIYAFTGSKFGSITTGTLKSTATASITPQLSGSMILCSISDYNAVTGSATYLDSPTIVLDDYESGAYRGYHFYETNVSNTSQNVGVSSPSNQASGIVVFEVRTI